jgi:hypothetical protein
MINKKNSQRMIAALVGFLLALVGGIDYLTGYEVHLGALYAVIVAYATWNLGSLFGIITALAATSFVFWAERASGLVYSHLWIGYTNSLSRLGIYCIIIWGGIRMRRYFDLAERRMQAFDRTLPICACCYRVDGGQGFWVDFPTYLRKNSDAQPTYSTCPICSTSGKSKASAGTEGSGSSL